MLDEIYSAENHGQVIRDWLSVGPPVRSDAGIATCTRCGGAFLYARIEDGRRFAFEPGDGGEWEIVGGLAKPQVGGEFVIHNCKRKR